MLNHIIKINLITVKKIYITNYYLVYKNMMCENNILKNINQIHISLDHLHKKYKKLQIDTFKWTCINTKQNVYILFICFK